MHDAPAVFRSELPQFFVRQRAQNPKLRWMGDENLGPQGKRRWDFCGERRQMFISGHGALYSRRSTANRPRTFCSPATAEAVSTCDLVFRAERDAPCGSDMAHRRSWTFGKIDRMGPASGAACHALRASRITWTNRIFGNRSTRKGLGHMCADFSTPLSGERSASLKIATGRRPECGRQHPENPSDFSAISSETMRIWRENLHSASRPNFGWTSRICEAPGRGHAFPILRQARRRGRHSGWGREPGRLIESSVRDQRYALW